MSEPTPDHRRDAVLHAEALQAVRDGWLEPDQVDEYVATMRATMRGQGMTLSFAARGQVWGRAG